MNFPFTRGSIRQEITRNGRLIFANYRFAPYIRQAFRYLMGADVT